MYFHIVSVGSLSLYGFDIKSQVEYCLYWLALAENRCILIGSKMMNAKPCRFEKKPRCYDLGFFISLAL